MDLVAENQAPSEGPQRPLRKKKRTARNVLFGVVAFVLVAALGAGVYAFNLASSFNSKSHPALRRENAFSGISIVFSCAIKYSFLYKRLNLFLSHRFIIF